MAVARVLTANKPPPNPIKKAPILNKVGDSSGSEKITQVKAKIPHKTPTAARRCESIERFNTFAASINASRAPRAVRLVSKVVALTDKPNTSAP